MCAHWSWAFRPIWPDTQEKLPPEVNVSLILGGLAIDPDQPMPDTTRKFIIQTWKKITRGVPDTYFNFDFGMFLQTHFHSLHLSYKSHILFFSRNIITI